MERSEKGQSARKRRCAMHRECIKCGRVVAEARYCPFCSEPTIEHFPARLSQRDAMTIRELFEWKQRSITGFVGVVVLIMLIAVGGWALLASFLNVTSAFVGLFAAVLSLTFILIGRFYERLFAFRCPRCEQKIDHLITRDQNIRYCPFCSVDLNVEIIRKSLGSTEFLNKEGGQCGLEIKNTDIQLPPRKQKANADLRLPHG
jgi:endogenous inhibitor of DNA gyrase (YacG/DUF329 family)